MKYLVYVGISFLTLLALSLNIKFFDLVQQTAELNQHLDNIERMLGDNS